MCRYKHLTLEDREGIMVMYIDGKSIADIADAIDRDKSTVSRASAGQYVQCEHSDPP